MPYQNLTSNLDNATKATIETGIVATKTALAPFTINLTAAEILAMYKMGPARQVLGERALDILRGNPTMFPPTLNLAAAEQDMLRFKNLVSLEGTLRAVLAGVVHGRIASGGEVMLCVKGIYKGLEAAAEQNIAGASDLYAQLKPFYDLPSQPDGGEENPVTP